MSKSPGTKNHDWTLIDPVIRELVAEGFRVKELPEQIEALLGRSPTAPTLYVRVRLLFRNKHVKAKARLARAAEKAAKAEWYRVEVELKEVQRRERSDRRREIREARRAREQQAQTLLRLSRERAATLRKEQERAHLRLRAEVRRFLPRPSHPPVWEHEPQPVGTMCDTWDYMDMRGTPKPLEEWFWPWTPTIRNHWNDKMKSGTDTRFWPVITELKHLFDLPGIGPALVELEGR